MDKYGLKFFNLVVFSDLKEAFDTVDHEILVEKLLLFRITDSISFTKM